MPFRMKKSVGDESILPKMQQTQLQFTTTSLEGCAPDGLASRIFGQHKNKWINNAKKTMTKCLHANDGQLVLSVDNRPFHCHYPAKNLMIVPDALDPKAVITVTGVWVRDARNPIASEIHLAHTDHIRINANDKPSEDVEDAICYLHKSCRFAYSEMAIPDPFSLPPRMVHITTPPTGCLVFHQSCLQKVDDAPGGKAKAPKRQRVHSVFAVLCLDTAPVVSAESLTPSSLVCRAYKLNKIIDLEHIMFALLLKQHGNLVAMVESYRVLSFLGGKNVDEFAGMMREASDAVAAKCPWHGCNSTVRDWQLDEMTNVIYPRCKAELLPLVAERRKLDVAADHACMVALVLKRKQVPKDIVRAICKTVFRAMVEDEAAIEMAARQWIKFHVHIARLNHGGDFDPHF